MRLLHRFALASALLALGSGSAQAHPLAPGLLDVRELEDGRAEILWKTSILRLRGTAVWPVLPEHCRALTVPEAIENGTSVTRTWTVSCGSLGLVGQRIGVEGLAGARIDVLVRIALADGRRVKRVLRARAPFITIPARDRRLDVARGYAMLGGEHILLGPDHLLFVLGLVLLVRRALPLVQTVSAFTVGHSITLALAALGFVRFPTGPIEVLIALSVFLLAAELARGETAPPTWVRRFPWVMATSFGLLHGLAFAGALSQVGLPEHEIPMALLAFNVGIELGQLLFILALLGVGAVLGAVSTPPSWARQVPVYAMGILAAFWCFQRAAELL